jgi:2-polyprenyl-6-methoxyphenol hydroxylase-like FAD-dependent oxidoreductase
MRVTDADVIIVGAGPTGLMLAGELPLAGVRPLVLERRPQPREIPRANGFAGQIVELLRYRGLMDRLEAASIGPIHTAPRVPFGGVHLDFSSLWDPPIWGCISRNRDWSASSTNARTSSAPRSVADTRWSGSVRTTPR